MESNFVSGVNVANGSNMTTNSSIYATDDIVILGKLDINNKSGITIHVNDRTSLGGLRIGDGTTNGTLETMGTITLKSGTTSAASGGANATFNNATIKLNGTHSDHGTSATGYIEIGVNNATVTIQGNTTIDLDLTNTVSTDGATIVIIGRGSDVSSNGTMNVSGNVSLTAYKMFTLTVNNSTAFSTGGAYLNDASLNATVTYRSSTSLGQTGNTQTVYDASKTAIAADTTVFQALAGMVTDTAINAAIKTMSPSTAGAAAASAAISGSSVNTANTRMAYMRQQTGLGKGMNAGGAAKDESMWLQIFGASIDQDTVSSVSGYDADGQGIAIGIDGMSADGTTRIGVAGSFANTDVDGKDSTTKTTEDINTTQVIFYANKDYADGMYLQSTASYSFNTNKGTRRILVGAVDRTASSAYDSGLFSIGVEAGWPTEDDGVTITPTAGLTFSTLSSDAYTETGAGNMNLSVTPGDVNTIEGKFGVKVTGKSVDADGGIGRPEVRVGVSHNFGDETADSTATFTAGGASFATTGVKTDTTKVDIGLGYTYTTPEGDTEISVNADGRKSSSYVQFGGGLTVKWKF
jgi:outer membrane autotransporter protein